jgi:peptidoglycan/xylan/chitin deacetylase (PgdA/CDA1 family)
MKNPLKRLLPLALLFFFALGSLWAEIRFDGLDLSADGRLLFKVRSDSPGREAYDTLFLADLETGKLTQMTWFPERLLYLPGKNIIQIQNRFGVFHSDSSWHSFKPYSLFDSFVNNASILQGKLSPLKLSPDGRYLLYLRSTSPAFGELFFVDLSQGTDRLVATGIELDLGSTPAVWAPDSSFFVYSKGGVVYYMSVRQLADQQLIAEQYRQIGPGRIGSVSSAGESSLFYLSGSLVYELNSRELFTRALYKGYLDIGRLVGKIPFDFDPNFDDFWISPRKTHLLLNKGGRNLFLYALSSEDFSSTGESQSLPYLYLPRNTRIKTVLWSRSGVLTILTEGTRGGRLSTRLYLLDVNGAATRPVFERSNLEAVKDVLLSADQSKAAVLLPDRVVLYDYATWREIASRSHPQPQQAAWVSENELLIAGGSILELYRVQDRTSKLISICQPDEYGFREDEKAVLARLGERWFRWELDEQGVPDAEGWQPTAAEVLRAKKTVSSTYRVYVEDTPDRLFHNQVMIRDIRKLQTRTLLAHEPPGLEPFPEQDEPLDFVIFDHGSRIRRREIALVFNLVDSVDGLPHVLAVLRDYGLRCTFFVNGEAIRSYPDAVREIAGSGHEVGSLFAVHFNMTDSRFKLDRDFIKRGLTRNEDEYYQATGRELALLWHAPFYVVDSDIVRASREMNYVYVGRDVDPLDWVTREMNLTTQNIYLPASRLLERVISQKKPGSIVPILVGTPGDGREDYFFQKLDLLVDALIKRGYDIVPVTTLIEHAE